MADVFISYKREDRRRIEAMSQALVDLGLSVWFDYSIDVGEDWSKRIQKELEEAQAIIVCWTPEACQSDWVKHEASIAMQRQVMLPLILKTCSPPALFSSIQAADLTDWDGSSTDRRFLGLLSRLEQLTRKKGLAKEGWQRAGGREGELVAVLRALLVAKARSKEAPFTYAEAQAALRIAAKEQGLDLKDFAQPSLWGALDEIADQNRRNREPPLGVLIVSEDDGLPGRGYFQKHVFLEGKHDTLEKQVFKRHLSRVRRHKWEQDP
jgi:TIR domain-containing protein